MEDFCEKERVIKFKCTDLHTMKVLFEIIGLISYGGIATLLIDKTGVKCTEVTTDNKIIVSFHLKAKKFLHFDIKGNPKEPVRATIKSGNLSTSLKGYGKRKMLNFEITYDENCVAKTFGISSEDETCILDSIELEKSVSYNNYVDHFVSYYKDRTPEARMSMDSFKQMTTRLKSGKYTMITFTNIESGIHIHAKKSNISEFQCSVSNGCTSDEVKEIEQETIVYYNDDGELVCEDVIPVSTTIQNLGKIAGWMNKISGCCNPNSIIEIYAKDNAPLIMRVFNNNMGNTYFGFIDSKYLKE